MHAVLGLVEDDRGQSLEHLVGHLHARDAELLRDLASDRGSRVVECRQAVHELHVRIAGLEQALVRNTKGLKERMRSAHLSLDSPIDSNTSV